MGGSVQTIKHWDKTFHERLRKEAEIVGGASSVALGRYNSAAEVVAAKLNGQFEEVEGAPEPTAAELAVLRERYLEHKALGERSQSLWQMVKDNPVTEIRIALAGTFLMLFYRLTVFAAAVAILHRAGMTYLAN